MANVCEGCTQSVYRTIFNTAKKQWLGVECGCTRRARAQMSTGSMFDITFDHVHDQFGNKVHVSSIRELERAEKTFGFQSVVLNKDAQNFDDAPQQPKVDVASLHKWKFSDQERYERRYGR